MCGIAGIHIKDPKIIKDHRGLERFVNKLLLGIESRGKHATGFVATTFNKKVVIDKIDKTASDFIKDREAIPKGAQTILLHTRWATQGEPTFHGNNHPVVYKTCFAVHNGHIVNDDELFEQFKLKRAAQVDSEIIAALASHIGLDDPPEFLKHLQGHMATAIIDPVNFPGRLILAKGESSPLSYIDTPKFIVWASMRGAIKDAWGEVLGTPPADNKFSYMPEGKGIAFDGKERTDFEYTVKRKVYSGTTAWHKNKSGVWVSGKPPANTHPLAMRVNKGSSHSTEDKIEENSRTTAVRNIVRMQRDKKDPVASCHCMDRIPVKDREPLYEKFGKHENNGEYLSWNPCPCCNEYILEQQFRQSMNWGKICNDCYRESINWVRIKNKIGRKEDEAEDETTQWINSGPPGANNNFGIELDEMERLSNFCSTEAECHRLALKAVEDETGIERDVIEWLIFRPTEQYLLTHPIMNDVREKLDESYNYALEDAWGAFGDTSSGGDLMGALETGGETCGVDDFCHDHGRMFGMGEECPECFHETTKNVPYTPAKCETGCGRYTFADTICFLCRAMGKGTEAKAQEALPGNNTETCSSSCKRPPRWFFEGHDKKLGWCSQHWNICNNRGCRKKANTVLKDGKRVCHVHSRGQRDSISDGQLVKNFGYAIVEKGK